MGLAKENEDEVSKNNRKNLILYKLKCYTSCTSKLKSGLYTSLNSDKWQFLVKKSANPFFTPFGTLRLAHKDLPLSTYKKVHNLYESILDAKLVLLRYKSDLTTGVGFENSCITPLVASRKLPMVFYKREDLTSIKAYKIRGALYQMSKVIEKSHSNKLRFVAASTGNHALGVLKAAEILKVPRVTICISESVTEFKKRKLEKRVNELQAIGINAELLIKGENFDQTNQIAKDLVQSCDNTYYVDPYNNQNAVAGQGTIGLELLQQLENQFFDFESLDFNHKKLKSLKTITIIVPIGGGGLISGISSAFKIGIQNNPNLKHLNVHIIGVKLKDLDSKHGDAIKVKRVGDHNSDLIDYLVDKQVQLADMDMLRGINFILDDISVRVEGAAAGTLKPVLENTVIPTEENAVICVLSGGNVIL